MFVRDQRTRADRARRTQATRRQARARRLRDRLLLTGYLNDLPIDTIKVDRTSSPSSRDRAGQPDDRDRDHPTRPQPRDDRRLRRRRNRRNNTTKLTKLGSDSCQGFYFAKPMLATHIDELTHGQASNTNPHPQTTTVDDRRLGHKVLHDDDQREFEYTSATEEALTRADTNDRRSSA